MNREYQKDNNYEEIVTSLSEIDDQHSYTVARVVEEGYSVELHYDKGKSYVEYMTEVSIGNWDGRYEDVEWFNPNLSEKYILAKLKVLYKEEFGEVVPVNERTEELKLLNKILNRHKVYDIELNIDCFNNLIAMDDDNIWQNKEFYDFLFDELFIYNKDEKVELIAADDLEKLESYRKNYEISKEIEASTDMEIEHE